MHKNTALHFVASNIIEFINTVKHIPAMHAVAIAILTELAKFWPNFMLPGMPMRESKVMRLKSAHFKFVNKRLAKYCAIPFTPSFDMVRTQLMRSDKRLFPLIGMDYQADRAFRVNLEAGRDIFVNIFSSNAAYLLKYLISNRDTAGYLQYVSCVNTVAKRAGFDGIADVLCLDKCWKGRKTSHVLIGNGAFGTPVCLASVPAVLDNVQGIPSVEYAFDAPDTCSAEATPTVQAGMRSAVTTEVPAEDMAEVPATLSAEAAADGKDKVLSAITTIDPGEDMAETSATAPVEAPSLPRYEMFPMPIAKDISRPQNGMRLMSIVQDTSRPQNGMPPKPIVKDTGLPQHGSMLLPPAEALNRIQSTLPATIFTPPEDSSFKPITITSYDLNFEGLTFNSHRNWTEVDFQQLQKRSSEGFVIASEDTTGISRKFKELSFANYDKINVLVPLKCIPTSTLAGLELRRMENPDDRILLIARLYCEDRTTHVEKAYALEVLEYVRKHPEANDTLLGKPRSAYPVIYRPLGRLRSVSELTGEPNQVHPDSAPAHVTTTAPAPQTGTATSHASAPHERHILSSTAHIRTQTQVARQKAGQPSDSASAQKPAPHAQGMFARCLGTIGAMFTSLSSQI